MSKTGRFVNQVEVVIQAFMFRTMNYVLQYSRKSGYSMSHIGALMHIHNKGNSAVSEIGEHLGVSKGAVSQTLERLVDEGLISRTEDPNDRRVKRISLTSKGLEILNEGMKARRVGLVELAASLNEEEIEKVTEGFEILLNKLGSSVDGLNPVNTSYTEQEQTE